MMIAPPQIRATILRPPSIEVGLAERALVTDLGVRGPDPGNPLDEVEQHESDPIGN